MMRASTGRSVLVLLLVMLQAGCGVFRRDREVFEPAPIMVAVENRNWSQVAVYVVAGGQRQRLGEVVGASAEEFTLPGMFTSRTDIRLVAVPLASRQQFATGVIVANPGATIQLVVENVLTMSSWSVR